MFKVSGTYSGDTTNQGILKFDWPRTSWVILLEQEFPQKWGLRIN